MVGRFLAGQAASQGRDVRAFTSAEWDITGPGDDFVSPGDVVVNCAAFTQVDKAETDPDRAHAVNVSGAGNVAQACARAGASLIHISTDYVFGASGARRPYDIDDETGPLSVYGRTKLLGEQAVLTALPSAYVVRTAWIYEGGHGTDFAAVMRRAASVRTPSTSSPTRSARRRTSGTCAGAAADRRRRRPRSGAARRQRRRGQPVRAGPRRVLAVRG